MNEIEYELVSGDDLHNRFYAVPSQSGVDSDIYERIKYLCFEEVFEENHVIATHAGRLVGVLGLQQSPFSPDEEWLKFVSVDPECRNNGIARHLYFMAANKVNLNGKKLLRSTPTEMGLRYLGRIVSDVHDKYPDLFINPPNGVDISPKP